MNALSINPLSKDGLNQFEGELINHTDVVHNIIFMHDQLYENQGMREKLYKALYLQGRSQNYIKGVLHSAGFLSVETQIHYLTKHLATKENSHHPVYDYSHYSVK